MRAFQRVKKILKNINPLIRNYLIASLLLEGVKIVQQWPIQRIFQKNSYILFLNATDATQEMNKILLQLTRKPQLEKSPKAFGVDPTHIIKPYAKYIEKLCYDRAGTSKRIEHCLVPIYAMVMDKLQLSLLQCDFGCKKILLEKDIIKQKQN